MISDRDFELHVGDVREVLPSLPAESVHCVVTSPPYWGLRDYGTGEWEGGDPDCDHVRPRHANAKDVGLNERTGRSSGERQQETAKQQQYRDVCGKCGARRIDQQLGLEATPDEYVASMVAVFREVRRVLRRDGTVWLNIGDSYASGNKGGPWDEERTQLGTGAHLYSQQANRQAVPGLKPKDLVGIPWRLALALQADGWWLRCDVIWSKPNPMPESTRDRPTKAHEYLFLLTKSARYFYDADAIREPAEWARWGDQTNDKYEGGEGGSSWIGSASKEELQRRATVKTSMPHGWATHPGSHGTIHRDGREYGEEREVEERGRNKRSVWEIPTEAYPDAHFATFPSKLVEPCILAGTSEKGCCPKCGAPWKRVTTERGQGDAFKGDARDTGRPDGAERRNPRGGQKEWDSYTEPETVGWEPTCRHGLEPVACVVLDPFIGSGTTAFVARRLGRRSVGVELNAEYADLVAVRLQQLSLFAELVP